MCAKKKGSPEWVERLLEFREPLDAEGDEYRAIWRRLNRVRDDRRAWNKLGREIIKELDKERPAPLFRAQDFKGRVKEARRAAEILQADQGGRIVRRNARGRFSSRGSIFQVIRGRK